MQNETSSLIEDVKNLFNKYFLPQFHNYINEHISFLKQFNDITEEYRLKYKNNPHPNAEIINNLKLSYYEKSYELISHKYSRRSEQNFNQDLPEFSREIDSSLNSLDEKVKRVQNDERFIAGENDSFKIKSYKRLKKFSYNISQLPVKLSNVFRRFFSKPLKEKKTWYYDVPLRNLAAFYLRDKVSLDFIPHIEEINKKIASSLLTAWNADEEFSNLSENQNPEFKSDIKKEIEYLERLPDDLDKEFEKVFNKNAALFEEAFKKAGTIELPARKFSSKKIINKHEELNEEYESLYDGWTNTFYTLFEDWRLNKELYTFNEKLQFEFKEISKKTDDKLNQNISPHLMEIKEFLDEVIYRFKGFSGSSSQVKSLLYRERDRIQNKLSKNVIPETSEVILSQNIPDLIDQMEHYVNSGISTLPEKRAIVKTTTYDRRIDESEIDYISPKEIITYSTLSPYLKGSSKIKSGIMQELDEVQKGLKDIDQIADFNIESALSMFRSDKSTQEDPLDIAIDGVNRAASKESNIERKLIDIGLKINKEFYDLISEVRDELIRLTKNENVLEIKLNIARTKTLQRTEELKHRSIHFIKNFLPIVFNKIRQGFSSVKNYYLAVRKKFGLAPRPVSISTEISDFLAATENAVSRLPFVYQRLFRIEPLEDERFFEGRSKELAHLNAAYESWRQKRYAPVIIYGEKGSGTTTLLNFYFKNLETSYSIIRTSIDDNIYNEKDFIDFLKNIFKKNTFNNIDDASDYLNDLVNKQIVVIENLQNLFLKKVNGFICLKLLFELISKTSRNVFWIISSTLYAWEYLSRVMNVSDYFGYSVKIEKLNNEQMIGIILKRHRISGYNIYFETSDQIVMKKKFRKLPEPEKQEILKREYFSELNEFAKSNISLALLFWMRSTKEVTADTIKLGSVVELDFSFLKIMSPAKLFILYLLLLHDGLTEEDVAKVYNKPLKEVRLILLVLLDDGIIIRKRNLNIINPLLYRQIVHLLKSKNIIH